MFRSVFRVNGRMTRKFSALVESTEGRPLSGNPKDLLQGRWESHAITTIRRQLAF
jgi:hypothetical protein